ncbi:hypothetical protein T4E_5129 [Trichinella pseudospiralis]|uniref:PiggyBac transposable element-derived protein domain-containing protein n=1 Tax=Trichinella pseudospiralis TaxID=6337 RepID=A0A0V0XG29_TRIPS|nr:hypothetical protein T4E_5129 [Trichinella pseudospiralis]
MILTGRSAVSYTHLDVYKRQWNKQVPPRNVRTRAHNIYSRRRGPRSVARRAKTLFEMWWSFMTKDIDDIYISKVWAK